MKIDFKNSKLFQNDKKNKTSITTGEETNDMSLIQQELDEMKAKYDKMSKISIQLAETK